MDSGTSRTMRTPLRLATWFLSVLLVLLILGGLYYLRSQKKEEKAVRADIVEMQVLSVVRDSLEKDATLILCDARRDTFLPIGIGESEALAIEFELYDQKPPRPLTSDLLKQIMEWMDARVVAVEITEVVDHTFYAEVHVEQAQENRKNIDARPSDAIGLALRFDAPIYVRRPVIERYGVFGRETGKGKAIKPRKVRLEYGSGRRVIIQC